MCKKLKKVTEIIKVFDAKTDEVLKIDSTRTDGGEWQTATDKDRLEALLSEWEITKLLLDESGLDLEN